MAELVAPGSEAEKKPFSLFMLPAVHNAGMNSMDNANRIISHVGIGFIISSESRTAEVLRAILDTVVEQSTLVQDVTLSAIHNYAITQKETTLDMLRLGTR